MLRVAELALKHGYSIEEISHAYDFFAFEGIIDDGADPKDPDHRAGQRGQPR